jgi:D-serine deaminase-like pyridoxal phosphate-dependent protein
LWRLKFGGILTHAGHAHDVTSAKGIAAVAQQEVAILDSLREEIEGAGYEVSTVTAGSTLTAHYLSAADGITEIRPRTYIYNDLRTVACWLASIDQIAAPALVTVVGAEGERVTVDAGSKTLTMTTEQVINFGHLLDDPSMVVGRLSEELGVLSGGHRDVGERMRILPIHVCVWMDLRPDIYGIGAN